MCQCCRMGNLRRRDQRDFLVDVTPYKPAETGYQQQQHPNACPAQPLVGTVPWSDLAAGFAGIFSKPHPAIFIGLHPGGLVRREVASDPLFLIEAYDPGVLSHHALVEYPARENLRVLLFESSQVAISDLRNPGYGVQRDPAELPFLP